MNPLVARRASAIGPDMTLPTPIVNSSIEMIVGGDEISFFAITVIILGQSEGKLDRSEAAILKKLVWNGRAGDDNSPQAKEAEHYGIRNQDTYILAKAPKKKRC